MPAAPLLLDSESNRDAVGLALRSLLAEPSKLLRFAVAYVAGDFQTLTGLSDRRLASLQLICDPFSGSCEPKTLLALEKLGAQIWFRQGLHAKIFILDHAIFLGSANLSRPALSTGNLEAATILRDRVAVARAHDWFDELDAKSMADVRADKARWEAIELAWRRTRNHASPGAVSLLTAFQRNLPELGSCIFSLAENRDLDLSQIRETATEHGLDLASMPFWDVEEQGAGSPGEVRALRIKAEGKSVVRIEIEYDKQRCLHRFKSLSPKIWEVAAILNDATTMRTFYVRRPAPFRLGGRDAVQLCRELTAGLRRHPRLASGIDTSDFVSSDVLAALLK